jgi:plasmid maintenance system antidote protein VapI
MTSTNPWSLEATNHVKTLKEHTETIHTCFEEYIDWMLDLSIRLPHIAALNIPENLKVGETEQSVIQLYCNTNEKINNEYWDILPKTLEFQHYFNDHGEEILLQILVRSHIRNQRLMNDKKNTHDHFKNQFDNALIHPNKIIGQFNELANIVTNKTTFCASNINQFFKTNLIQSMNIDDNKAKELINESTAIAKEMIALEEQIGTENWLPFSSALSLKKQQTISCKK